MKINNPGSALLTFFLILSSLTLLCSLVWLSAALLFDTSLQKQEYELAYQQTTSILKYGISLCKKKFAKVQTYLKHNKTLVITMPLNSVASHKDRSLKLKMSLLHENTIFLQSYLLEHEKTIFQSSCECVKGEEKSSDTTVTEYYAISSWNKKNGA